MDYISVILHLKASSLMFVETSIINIRYHSKGSKIFYFQITVEQCSMSHEPSEIILICWFAKNKKNKKT